MKINLVIENEAGEVVFRAEKLSVETIVQELYRFERNVERNEKLAETGPVIKY